MFLLIGYPLVPCLPIDRLLIKNIICIGILFFVLIPAHADSVSEILTSAQQLHLADYPTWHKLLHVERGKEQSVVLTDHFFLSPSGRNDPQAELTATINAYFAPWNEDADQDARCRFPARYYWLSQRLNLPDYQLRNERCANLEKWALFDSVKSVSLLLVSGYLGNPASTFGHALLKFNTDSIDDEMGLFDTTLNYGALVPEHENALRYVGRGLLGGYQAGFSDKYFYTQDMVYSHKEFRDIWDYRLALTNEQRTLLLLHTWEILGNKFTYYFLDKNCAYRLAELIELVIDENLVHNGRFWYVPVELFYRLKEIDQARRAAGQPHLIDAIHFVPSSQRILYNQLKRLSANEFRAFNAVLRDGNDSIPKHLTGFAEDRQSVVLDGLLAYQQYRLIAEEPNPSREHQELKDQILLARLHLPARPMEDPHIPELASPAVGSRPIAFAASAASEKEGNPYLRLSLSPFKQDLVGQNSLEGDEFVVLDAAVGFFEEEHTAFLDQFDLIRILKLNTLAVSAPDERQWSWKLRVGVDRIKNDEDNQYDGIFSFGAGQAWKWNSKLTAYTIVDVAGHTLAPYARLRPHLGIRWDWGATRAWTYFGAESIDYNPKFSEVWGGKVLQRLSSRSALSAEVTNERATRYTLGLEWYW